MALAFDAVSENVGSGSPQEFTHTPTGTPRGVAVLVFHTASSGDRVSGVTYGGQAMTRQQAAFDGTGDLGAAYVYTLVSSIPTGAQTVSVAKTGLYEMHVVVITATAAGAVEVVSSASLAGEPNVENPSILLETNDRDCMVVGGEWNGVNIASNLTDRAGQTRAADHDFGSEVSVVSYTATPSATDFTFGYTATGTPNFALVGVAFAEAAATGSTGSGAPTSTLSSSASGTAVQAFSASGAPTSTLSSSASGTATHTVGEAGSADGSGSPTSTLTSSASGTATQTKDVFTGSGTAVDILNSSVSATATQTFSGSGAITSTLSSTAAGTASQSVYEGPTFVAATGVASSTTNREVRWPGVNAVEEDSAVQIGDIALLFVGTKNQAVGALAPGSADSTGDTSVFTAIPEATFGIGVAGDADAVRIEVYWARATSHHMRSVLVPDPGAAVVAAIELFRGCIATGNPYNVVSGANVSPGEAVVRMQELVTTVANCLIVMASVNEIDLDSAATATDYVNASLTNLTERNDRSFTTGPGGIGLVVITGEKMDAGNVADTTGTYVSTTRSATASIALIPPTPPSNATGSGAATSTLSSSAVGAATSTPQNSGSGILVSTLTSTAAGTASQLADHTGSGAPVSTLESSASGTASSTGVDQIVGSGAPVSTLESSASGLAYMGGPIFGPRPPRTAVPGQGRRKPIIVWEQEAPPKRKRKRRARRAPAPVPEAMPLPDTPELPTPFAPYTFDPMLWQSLTMSAPRVQPPVVTQQDIAEEEEFLSRLLEVI